MEIYEYSQVDPLEVLHLNLLCLGFSLTPEYGTLIRHYDPRAFPFFCIYAKIDNILAGQVGVFRLPVVSTKGVGEVGGVWAVSTHPSFSRHGVAYRLLSEAHGRMRAAGLRFSTLGTDRFRVAHRLYEKLGYEDVFSSPSAISRRERLPSGSELRAERAGSGRLQLADDFFGEIAGHGLGFARRHTPFFSLLDRSGYLGGQDLWLVWKGDRPVGYLVALLSGSILRIPSLLLSDQVDPVTAVAAVVHQVGAAYVQVTIDKPSDTDAYLQAGFSLTDREWGTFMVKPLVKGATVDEFRRYYGVGTDRFLISYLDIT